MNEQGYHAYLNQFFELLSQKRIGEAVDSIYQTNPYMSGISDQLHNLKSQLIGYVDLISEYHGHEIIDEKDVAGCFVYIYALGLYSRQPVKMEFGF